jgi:hypothetical protein
MYTNLTTFREITNIKRTVADDGAVSALIPTADRLINKLISTRETLERVDGDIDGSNTYFYTQHKPICDFDIANKTVLDNCDATTDWTASTDASAAALTGGLEPEIGGSGLALGKSGETVTSATYTKTIGATKNGTDQTLKVDVFIQNIMALEKNKAMEIRVGNDSSNYYSRVYRRNELKTGINKVSLEIADMKQTGTPAIATLDYLYIGFEVPTSTDTITSGDIIMDNWILEDTNFDPTTDDVEVYGGYGDDNNRLIYTSKMAVTAILGKEGRIQLTTAPTSDDDSSTGAELGLYVSYSHSSKSLDWSLIPVAASYMLAHLISYKIAGESPNYTSIAEGFMRRDIAGAPDDWLRLCYSTLINAIGEGKSGIGLRHVNKKISDKVF